MDDIERAIVDAFARLDLPAAEVARRRRRFSPRAVPRAWCLAIRASDTRLARNCCSHPNPSHAHELILDTADVRRLCSPVVIDPPGEPIDVVARKLGTTRAGLLHARVAGIFQTHHVRNLGRPGGKPSPLLYSRSPLDPSSRLFAPADPVWSRTAHNLAHRLDGSFEQVLTRVPHFVPRGPSFADPATLHPEHPDLDPPFRVKKSLRLAKPPPDYVWYKWDGDTYLGYDKTNPRAKAAYEKHQRQLALSRSAAKRRRASHPRPTSPQGSLVFQGWKWQCPRCDRRVNVLYLPLRAGLQIADCKLQNEKPTRNSKCGTPNQTIDAPSANLQSAICNLQFRCERCTSIRRFSRCDPNAWNEIVRYLSSGLLYGREVPRPAWWPRPKRVDRLKDHEKAALSSSLILQPSSLSRKIPYTPRPRRDPSVRRPQIQRLLLAGMSFKDIAQALGLSKGTVLWHARQVYKTHGVRSLPELLRLHGHPDLAQRHRGAHSPEIRRRLLAGQSVAQISVEVNVPTMMIYNLRQRMRKEGIELPDARRQNRINSGARPAACGLALPTR